MKLTTAQIDKAVAWWMEKLRHPTFDMLGKTRHQHRDDASEMSEIMATVAASKNPTPQDAIEKFGADLRRRLEAANPAPYGLLVDYGPEGALFESAQEVGLSTGVTTFPWKTRMWFQDGGVQVACGYGAQSEEVLKGK